MAKLIVCCFKQVYFLSILMLASGMTAIAFGDQFNPRIRSWNAAENRGLVSFSFAQKTVSSRAICAMECSMNEHCASFNFHEKNKLCQMNNATKSGHLENFLKEEGCVYFDTNEDTPLFSLASEIFKPQSCKKLLEAGYSTSGVYTIYPEGLSEDGLRVYCDMKTDGGGWVVFQSRQDGSVDFYRDWMEYQSGFGDLDGEFWLGNDNLAILTSSGPDDQRAWQLRIDLGDWDEKKAWSRYNDFKVSGDLYTLSVSQYDANSSAGDSLKYHNGQAFSAKNSDNDQYSAGNCATDREGAWWFNACDYSHLNGKYYAQHGNPSKLGIVWDHWLGENYSLKNCSMKIREIVL